MEVQFANAKIRKELSSATVEAGRGNSKFDAIRRLMGSLKSAKSLADILPLKQYDLHWLQGNLKQFVAMRLDGGRRLLSVPVDGERGEWASHTIIRAHKIDDYH
jgi:hypothetical protein